MRAAMASAGAALLEAVLACQDGRCRVPGAERSPGRLRGLPGQDRHHRARPGHAAPGVVSLRAVRSWFRPPGPAARRGRRCAVAGRGRDDCPGRRGGLLRPGRLPSSLAGITVTARTIERSAEASGAAARAAAGAEAAAIRARDILPLPPPEPVPDMLYVEADGTGVPVRASETEGLPGKDDDGKAGTREVKLARLFTVSCLDDDGRPVMDPGSSTYVATFGGKNALAQLVEAEYLRRGGEHFRQVVALGDGAAWIWTMAEVLYPQATHITDIYHAREHLTDLANHLAFITPTRRSGWPTGMPSWTPGASMRSSRPPAPTHSTVSRPATWNESSATSATTPTGCATPASRSWACSPARAQSKAESRPSSSSAPSNQACTGRSTVPRTSSASAASTPAAVGTNYGHPARPAQPGSGLPSDRHRDSDPEVTSQTRSSPTKLSHTRRCRAAVYCRHYRREFRQRLVDSWRTRSSK